MTLPTTPSYNKSHDDDPSHRAVNSLQSVNTFPSTLMQQKTSRDEIALGLVGRAERELEWILLRYFTLEVGPTGWLTLPRELAGLSGFDPTF